MTMQLTPTQAALLHRGLDRFIKDPEQILETDARRTIWTLAQCAARSAAEDNDLAAMQAASDLAQEMQPPPEYITLAEASERYGLAKSTLRYHATHGHFAAEKRGKVWWADHHDLIQWLESK